LTQRPELGGFEDHSPFGLGACKGTSKRCNTCEKFVEIDVDERIERYRTLGSRLLDSSMIEAIEMAIVDLPALKEQFHPAQEE
jgi:hypothetical protein